MSTNETMGMDELHSMTTEDLFRESATENSIRTGTYLAQLTDYNGFRNDPENEWNPNRFMIMLTIQLVEETGTRMGTPLTARVSPEVKKIQTRRGEILDNAARLYKALVDAVAPGNKNVGEVMDKAKATLFKVSVAEQYVVPEEVELHDPDTYRTPGRDTWVTIDADADEARNYYAEQGLDPRTTIRRFYKA